MESVKDFFTTQFGFSLALAIIVFATIQGAVAYCILLERKIAAWTQDRYGPNRAGKWGLLQPFADGLKFVFKEDYIPGHVDKALFVLAPGLMFLVAGITFLVIPWGGKLDASTIPLLGAGLQAGERLLDVQIVSLNVGLLYMLAIMSLSVYGVVLGGWSSNNKYSFYGAIRACAQMLAYEIPMGLAILIVVLTMGTLRLENIVADQAATGVWNVFRQPIAALILFITALAEANRAPFDLAEAEQELVGGYHTEYGALKFGMFFLAEYASMITTSALVVVLFFGGWHFWGIAALTMDAASFWAALARMTVLGAKVAVLIFIYMWIRWSLPRFRFDQLMRLAWKSLVPMSLGLFVWAVVLLYVGWHTSIAACLAGNALVLIAALIVASRAKTPITGRQANLIRREAAEEPAVFVKAAEALDMIRSEDIVLIDAPTLSAGERLFIPQIIGGMTTTLRHMYQTVLRKKAITVQYPEEKRTLRVENYRGIHRLNRDHNGHVACVACFMCSTACPAHCIHIEAGESPWPDREKYPVKFDIDELRCIYCGMCEEACPVDAIELTPDFSLVGRTRDEMILGKEELLAVFDSTKDIKPRKDPHITGYPTSGRDGQSRADFELSNTAEEVHTDDDHQGDAHA